MAELINHGGSDIFELTCYIGSEKDIIISLDGTGEPEVFIKANIFETKKLIEKLNSVVSEYKKEVNEL